MRGGGLKFGLGLAALLAVSSAQAATPEAAAAKTSVTPTEDLECAVWAAAVAGSAQNAELQSSATSMLAFFVGRYEGAVGDNIDKAFLDVAPKVEGDQAKLAALNTSCPQRVLDFGLRMSALGDVLVSAPKPDGNASAK